jgi:hypothetical protein
VRKQVQLYGVIIMDIVNSRNIKNRPYIQQLLMDKINYVNKKHIDLLPSPIDITLGDEWQVVTDQPHRCYELVDEFQQILWSDNVKFYAGIGIGPISTNIYPDIRKMDGICFSNARQAINIAKKKPNIKNKPIHSKNNRVFFYYDGCLKSNALNDCDLHNSTENTPPYLEEIALTLDDKHPLNCNYQAFLGDLINTLIENNEILKDKMTEKQRDAYCSYNKLGSYRKMVELDENHSKDSIGGISQKLNAANYFTIKHNQRIIASLLHNYCK